MRLCTILAMLIAFLAIPAMGEDSYISGGWRTDEDNITTFSVDLSVVDEATAYTIQDKYCHWNCEIVVICKATNTATAETCSMLFVRPGRITCSGMSGGQSYVCLKFSEPFTPTSEWIPSPSNKITDVTIRRKVVNFTCA